MSKRIVLSAQPWYAMVHEYGLDAKRRTCGFCVHRVIQGTVHWCEKCAQTEAVGGWWPEYAAACGLFGTREG